MNAARPYPSVGAHVRKDYGIDNPSTWRQWGEVRAIVDQVIVVRRVFPGSNGEDYWHYEIINPDDWRYMPWKVQATEREP